MYANRCRCRRLIEVRWDDRPAMGLTDLVGLGAGFVLVLVVLGGWL